MIFTQASVWKKAILMTSFVVVSALSLPGTALGNISLTDETIYQARSYSDMKNAVPDCYDGIMTLQELSKHGDFGIGTFVGIDGEMVYLDKVFYQVKVSGEVIPKKNKALKKELTPYAVVTKFNTDIESVLGPIGTYEELKKMVEAKLPNTRDFYAIRIDGKFDALLARSVPPQSKPYISINDVVKLQNTFPYENIEGTLVGFWCPGYIGDVNVAGFHLHFISKDRTKGGHVLEFKLNNGVLKVDDTREFHLKLP